MHPILKKILSFSFEVQTNQIFLGMVAMQYEACMDMVGSESILCEK